MTTILLTALFCAEVTAEFWGRTVPLKNDQGEMKAVASEQHLVVEATVRTEKRKSVRVTPGQFRLRINGAKYPLAPDTPGMASAAMQYPDWNGVRGVEAQAGPVIIGRPRPVPRFPGDPAGQSGAADNSGAGKTLDQAVAGASWVDGDVVGERTGLLFFAWKGKMSKIKTLELIWQAVDEVERVVKLR